jgi:hypothetical protein
MDSPAYPDLWQLLAGYFHQDWGLDYHAPPEKAISAYLAEYPELKAVVRYVDGQLAVVGHVSGFRAPRKWPWPTS